MIQRRIESLIEKRLGGKKAILLMGARQIGKTTALRSLIGKKKNVLWLNGDTSEAQQVLAEASETRLRAVTSGYSTLVIDEAQQIPDIGRKIKIFTDLIPEIKVIATGSSAFELANKTSESLTGRKWEYRMYPLSFGEMCTHHGFFQESKRLSHRLIYGYYPEVVTSEGNEKAVLSQITDSYLYKDLLIWGNIRHSDVLVKLLQALALQLGNEVSTNELSKLLGIDRGTIERYIDLLEKTYVIFRLPALSRNYRNELKNARKYYFIDNGIRNALISNFAPLELRSDIGALWENFVLSERIKKQSFGDTICLRYFWRTTTQVEIDYIEEADGHFSAYEFKWNPAKAGKKIPASFASAYPESSFKVITPQNFEEFLM